MSRMVELLGVRRAIVRNDELGRRGTSRTETPQRHHFSRQRRPSLGEAGPARSGDFHRARMRQQGDPAELEPRTRRAAPSRPPRCGRRSLQSRQTRHSGRLPALGPRSIPSVSPRKSAPARTSAAPSGSATPDALPHQAVRDRHAEAAREMVVAGAGRPQCLVARPAGRWRLGPIAASAATASIAPRNLGRGQPVVAMTTLPHHRDQMRLHELGEVPARSSAH